MCSRHRCRLRGSAEGELALDLATGEHAPLPACSGSKIFGLVGDERSATVLTIAHGGLRALRSQDHDAAASQELLRITSHRVAALSPDGRRALLLDPTDGLPVRNLIDGTEAAMDGTTTLPAVLCVGRRTATPWPRCALWPVNSAC